MSLTVTSFMPSGNATVTRNADVLSFPFTARPQAMTVYCSFFEEGAIATPAAVLWTIGAASPRLQIVRAAVGSAGYYRISYTNNSSGSGGSTPSIGTSPSIGDLVELRATITASGVIQLGQSINRGVELVSGTGGPFALPQSWSVQTLYMGNNGAGVAAQISLQSFLVLAGVQSLATMQRRAGTFQR